MLSIEDNETITRVGPGTPMGELMRRYWQPVCAVDQLISSPFRTKEIEVLGEELVIFRDRKGNLGVVDKYCAHRRANLAYGVVEDGLRCQYHGWKFNGDGKCIEQQFEDTTHPEDSFRDKCGIRAYKAQELAGLVFVYMGPDPAPMLPSWEPLMWDQAVRDIAITHLPCNWLQCQENSLDPVHLEWLHGYSGVYFRKLLGGVEPDSFATPNDWRHREVGFDAFPYGIIKRRYYKGQTKEDDEWKIGHPVLFPNILLVGNPLSNTLQWRVPIDDTHTLHFSLYTWRAAPGAQAPRQDVVPSRIVPLTDEETQYFLTELTFNQDYLCWVTQGDIAKRHLEKLGESDKGIIMFRKMLIQQIEVMHETGSPTMNIFRTPEENESIQLPTEPSRFDWFRNGRYRPQEAGYSRDADKFEAVMATWKELSQESVRQLVTA